MSEKISRPFSQTETPAIREPPPASKTELAWEAGLKQWRKLKRVRAQFFPEGPLGLSPPTAASTEPAAKRARVMGPAPPPSSAKPAAATATRADPTATSAGAAAAPTSPTVAEAAKVDYKSKLDKYQKLLKVNQDHRKLMEELRQIEDQTVARTIEDDSDLEE